MKFLRERFNNYKSIMEDTVSRFTMGSRTSLLSLTLDTKNFFISNKDSAKLIDKESNKFSDVYIVNDFLVIKLIPLYKEDLQNLSNMSNEKRKEIYVCQLSTELILLKKTPSLVMNYIYGVALDYTFKNPNIIEVPEKTFFLIMEYIPYNLYNYLKKNIPVYKKDKGVFKELIDILIFQMMYVFLVLSKNRIVYHNDLHLRNILVQEHEEETEVYEIEGLKFKLTNKKINTIIHDFGKADILSLDSNRNNRRSKQQMEQLNNNEFILTDIYNLFDNIKFFCEENNISDLYKEIVEPKKNAIRNAQLTIKNLSYPAYIELFILSFPELIQYHFTQKITSKIKLGETIPKTGSFLYDTHEKRYCLLLISYGLKMYSMYEDKSKQILDYETDRFQLINLDNEDATTYEA